MEIVTHGCSLSTDLVIGQTCMGGTLPMKLLAVFALTLIFGVVTFAYRKLSAPLKTPQQRLKADIVLPEALVTGNE